MTVEKFAKKNVAVLNEMIEELELPKSAYEKAILRYEDLGEWLGRDGSKMDKCAPHVFAQGSFRLGTAIYPLNRNDGYDLDLVCKLEQCLTKQNTSQEDLKALSKDELEGYRKYRGIQTPLDEKHRCWCLQYKDELSFHMDVVPAIPENDNNIFTCLSEGMARSGMEKGLADEIADSALAITDNRNANYRRIDDDWNISNPNGYAKWFVDRMNSMMMMSLSEERAFKAQVDELPLYERKTPLQRVIQLLKRHRDKMFDGEAFADRKPISIIITTLAAMAYEGQTNLEDALMGILDNMGALVNNSEPRVPNPVNSAEDFADKWGMPKYKYLELEKNFFSWLKQARADFYNLLHVSDRCELMALSEDCMHLVLSDNVIRLFEANTSIEIPSYEIKSPQKPHRR